MRMLLFGPPGVGKGTQADILAQHYHFTKFSMGDVLREEVAGKTELGEKISAYLNQGTLVPDEIVSDIMRRFLNKNQHAHILFDGFPRTLAQAQHLDDSLTAQHMTLDAAVEMYASNDEIVKRLAHRWYCPSCGRVYNLITNPPTHNKVCDICHTILSKREDDDAEIIQRRLEVYIQETQPLVNYYKSRNVYTRINAEGTQDEVFAQISTIINAYITEK